MTRESKQSAKNKSFFDTHGHAHTYHRDPDFYHTITDSLKKKVSPLKLLDLGCGDGSFIKSIAQQKIKGNYLGIDLSTSMLFNASENLRDYNVNLIMADGFALPLKDGYEFDLIHLDSVLHHLVGKNRSKSKDSANRLLSVLLNKVSPDGVLVVEEFIYDSYIISELTATIIFYGLKLINFFGLDLSRVIGSILPGLEVNFYSERELFNILCQYGNVKLVKKIEGRVPRSHKLLLQKKLSHISYIVEKQMKK